MDRGWFTDFGSDESILKNFVDFLDDVGFRLVTRLTVLTVVIVTKPAVIFLLFLQNNSL